MKIKCFQKYNIHSLFEVMVECVMQDALVKFFPVKY